jgi:hypothetical protein
MKKLQVATILSIALFGADCNGMTPDAQQVVNSYYCMSGIPLGRSFWPVATLVCAAKGGRHSGGVHSALNPHEAFSMANNAAPGSRFESLGFAMNRLADEILALGLVIKEEDGTYSTPRGCFRRGQDNNPKLNDALSNLRDAYRNLFVGGDSL